MMRRSIHRIVLAALVPLALGACSGSGDPRKAGIIDVFRNEADGTYAARTEARRARNAAALEDNAALHRKTARLEAERAELRGQVARARGQVRSLQARVDGARKAANVSAQRLAELKLAEQALREADRSLQIADAQGSESDLLEALERIALTEEEYGL